MKTKFAVVLLALLALSACKVRYEVGTVVEADGSGTLTIAIGLDEEFRQLLSGEFLGGLNESFGGEVDAPEDPIEKMLNDAPEGWDAQRFEEGDLEGVRLTRAFSSVEELNELVAESDRLGEDLGDSADPTGGSGDAGAEPDISDGYSLTRDGDIFTFRFEPAAAGLAELGSLGAGSEEFFGGEESPFEFEILLRTTLPGKIVEDNADEKDGNELVWRLTPTDTEAAAARSDASQGAGGSGFPWWILAVAAVVIAAVVFLVVSASRKQGEPQAVSEMSDAPPPPPDSGGTPPPPPPPPPS